MPNNICQVQIIGCGDIGRRVAAQYRHRPEKVAAWVHGQSSQQLCENMGLPAFRIDLDQSIKPELPDREYQILYTVPPPSTGLRDTRLANLLKNMNADPVSRFILISTSGVYGDCGGAWVDENTPIHPGAERAHRRADAENQLKAWATANDVEWLILRVPGIYAPDRLPLKRLQAGHPLVARSEAPWTNRIHAEDLASACVAALEKEVSNELINIVDDEPSTMTDYFIAAADYAGLPHPKEIPLAEAKKSMSAGMLSYMSESRRIRNDKMKKLLGIQLRYPGLSEGLGR